MRKLASVRRIDAINPIPNADAIECAVVGGWTVVVKKGEYKPGDLAVYVEIDAWVPTTLAPFLSKGKEPRVYNGVPGEKLRTVKLRGQLSQGLLLPVDKTEDGVRFITGHFLDDGIGTMVLVAEGDDVTEALGIQKWEPVIPAQLQGQMKGTFPSFIPKTDQERVQNLQAEISAAAEKGMLFEVTEKLEGSSMTVYFNQGVFGVCSRNIELKVDDNNSFSNMARDLGLQERLFGLGANIAIQGELIGPSIQGNIYGLSRCEFYVFDVYNIDTGEYFLPKQRIALCEQLGLKHVPVLAFDKDVAINDINEILSWADGVSRLNLKTEREGIVFKQMDGGMTFKAISNSYLLGS